MVQWTIAKLQQMDNLAPNSKERRELEEAAGAEQAAKFREVFDCKQLPIYLGSQPSMKAQPKVGKNRSGICHEGP